MTIIYNIRNTVTDKIYIGSSVEFGVRKRMHLHQLRKNKHHSILLQRAWNKYGSENFVFELIEIVKDKNELLKREQVWINFFKPEYNISDTVGYSMLGKKHKQESIDKMIKSRTGIKHPYRPIEMRKRFGEKNRKAVHQMDESGNILNEFESTREAAKHFNTCPEAIQQAIKHNRRSCKFWWKYTNQEYNPIKKRITFV